MRRDSGNLRLGSRVIELLLPYRRPFLMVDHVASFAMEPTPAITAGRHVSLNEAWFDGHVSGLPLWPGALTMEGLGQSGVLLLALIRLRLESQASGRTPEELLESLRNLDRGYRLHPGFRPPDETDDLLARLRAHSNQLAVGAAVDMKFVRPVFPGCRIDYAVELTNHLDSSLRFAAEATVDGDTVARGTITGAVRARPILPLDG